MNPEQITMLTKKLSGAAFVVGTLLVGKKYLEVNKYYIGSKRQYNLPKSNLK